MTKSERLKPLVRMAESKEMTAARELGECMRVLNDKQARLDDLLKYRQEYAERFQREGSVGMSARKMHDFRAFLANLDKGIEQQQGLVEQAAKILEEKRQQWFSKRTRTKALDNAVARYQSDEQRSEERRVQKESDERAIHDYGRNKKSE
ncbi:MAG: flagellar export protein FliJ [Gammaproteobacteria bacterium RBG_16_57_12]|nr:MAG: flagellar export protein FliJ [Gammaproteobacteria bacterium RBG_16_57_12]